MSSPYNTILSECSFVKQRWLTHNRNVADELFTLLHLLGFLGCCQLTNSCTCQPRLDINFYYIPIRMTYKSFYIFCACNVVKLSPFCDTMVHLNIILIYDIFILLLKVNSFECQSQSYTNYKYMIKLYKPSLYYFRNAINYSNYKTGRTIGMPSSHFISFYLFFHGGQPT